METKNVNPESSGEWNSDAIVLGNISCAKAAGFMEIFMSAFRNIGATGQIGGIEVAEAGIQYLQALVESSKEKKVADETVRIAVAGVGTAIAVSAQFGDPYDLANLAENANNTVFAIVENDPKALLNKKIKFGVKAGNVPGSMEVGASLVGDGDKLFNNLSSQNPDAN